MLDKVAALNGTDNVGQQPKKEALEKLTEDELQILQHIRAKQMLRMEDTFNLQHFGSDPIDGFAPHLERGSLGLVAKSSKDIISKLEVPVVDLLVQVEETEPIAAAA